MALSRDQITVPELTANEEPCSFLGGSVLVRVLSLADRLVISARRDEDREGQAHPGDCEAVVKARADAEGTIRTVSTAVIDPDGEPLLSPEQWERLAAIHNKEFLEFSVRVINRALGSPEAAVKN